MNDNKFFFIIICYNNLQGLQRTVDSLRAQQYPSWQCVIIDGNSRDGTKPYLRQLTQNCANIMAISEPDRGIYDAMNKGIGHIPDCDYFCFLNSGDSLYTADTLFGLNRKLCQLEGKQPAILYGDTCEAFADGKEVVKPANLRIALQKGMFCHHQSMFFHRRYADLRYDLAYKLSGDYDYIIRAVQGVRDANGVLHMDMVLSRFDMTGVSNSRRIEGIKEDFRLRVKNGLCSSLSSAFYAVRSLSLMGLKQLSYSLYLLIRNKVAITGNQVM